MPKNDSIKKVLIIGAGPIVIGQACEFDYSGTQACKALKEEGVEVVLVNSNPATIMTDPELADATYIEPIRWDVVAKIIDKEQPDSILATMGGQTALNCALDLERHGVLEQHGIQLLGINTAAIDRAEDRSKFIEFIESINLKCTESQVANTQQQALEICERLGFPIIIRPSFTMGGTGGGIAYNLEEFNSLCELGFELAPTHELLIDRSIIGWKEFEMEVMIDDHGNAEIICTIENVDPMGIHTGDSITVAPALTLTDKEYQAMRDATLAVIRGIGMTSGGANVQFAQNPKTGDLVVIEMNPRVSRSSALASKATGFPIARVATKLALGYSLNELRNAITGDAIPASFEPSLDYVVVKIPRFNFEKFPNSDDRLTTQMKSVGEVLGIGRNFTQALQKAMRSLEIDSFGFESKVSKLNDEEKTTHIKSQLSTTKYDRLWYIADAYRQGMTTEAIHELCYIDPWFLNQISMLVTVEAQLKTTKLPDIDTQSLRHLKQIGFSDQRLAFLLGVSITAIQSRKKLLHVLPTYKRIDSCASEFPTPTAYLYSTYEQQCESLPSSKKKIIVLGGGPNRIGQGLEFDYCCVHAIQAIKKAGYEAIMINCNPETVSTDYDTSDRLYFEPLTLEDVLAIINVEQPEGVIVHFGGQTPLNLTASLEAAGVPIIGTSPDAIARAENRARFSQLATKCNLTLPPHATAKNNEEAATYAEKLGYPIIVRPSYVLGGRGMEIIYQTNDLKKYLQTCMLISETSPLLLDRFLQDAIEVDVDAVSDGTDVWVAGIMEHIELAGVHSGDSACTLPAHSLSSKVQQQITQHMTDISLELGVVGLINAQFAIQDGIVYILEVNPRASRTVPFVSKAINQPIAQIAVACKLGKTLKDMNLTKPIIPNYWSSKQVVFPFNRFPGSDPILGPEMRSTGEVMGIGKTFAHAYAKGQMSTGHQIPQEGTILISVRDQDKTNAVKLAQKLSDRGYSLIATKGTYQALSDANILCKVIPKVNEGRPHIVDCIKNKEVDFIINTTEGKQAIEDSFIIRKSALQYNLPYATTLKGALAACQALGDQGSEVFCLQKLHNNQLSHTLDTK
jgi:carbamoyl-phosphate synthase large subunit